MARDRKPSLVAFFRAHSVPMLGTILAISLLDGLFAAWVAVTFAIEVANLHVSIWAFLVVWAALVGYTAYKRVPSGVIGMGLYVMGVFVFLKPITLYLPRYSSRLAAADRLGAARSAGELFIWTLFFLVLAMVLFLVGNYFRTRAESVAAKLARRGLRTHE